MRRVLASWFDAGSIATAGRSRPPDAIDWPRIVPFVALHAACLLVLWVGVSPLAVWVCLALYAVRMFALTAFYHRYFAHRAFETGRVWQALFAVLGATCAQRGPLWWAAHHRRHHKFADTDRDSHGARRGFVHSHLAWFLTRRNFATDLSQVPDLARYPELRFLDRFDALVPLALLAVLIAGGEVLAHHGWDTSGVQLGVWGFCVSTVLLFHATSTVNSLAHRVGRRRYRTADDSRNNLAIALLTFGEGWHNNHHRYPVSARQGFRWFEVDVTYYLLRLLAWAGVVRNLRPVPAAVVAEGRR